MTIRRPQSTRRTARTGRTLTVAVALAVAVGAVAPATAGADTSPCSNWFMASDLRCTFFDDLDAEAQADVAATAAELAAIPSDPAEPRLDDGGPLPDIPADDPVPAPVTGILDDIGAPEPPSVFLARNNYTGFLPNGNETRVWAGASGIDPTLGEVMTVVITADTGDVLSTKLVTAPSIDGPLVVSAVVDESTLALTAANGRTFRYPINGDHILPVP